MKVMRVALTASLLFYLPLVGHAWADNSDRVQTSSPDNTDSGDFYSPPLGGESCTVPDLIS